MAHPWDMNEHGYWCTSCGDLVGRADVDEDRLPTECRHCGFPDPDKVADYHLAPDDDEYDPDDEDHGAECGRWINGKLGKSCTLAGTEFCDWDCPYS